MPSAEEGLQYEGSSTTTRDKDTIGLTKQVLFIIIAYIDHAMIARLLRPPLRILNGQWLVGVLCAVDQALSHHVRCVRGRCSRSFSIEHVLRLVVREWSAPSR